jgi:tRNA pseudouridine32 synthase / 23S rRNA pseudouridine746 synthase
MMMPAPDDPGEPLTLLYRDAMILVVDKPFGMPVHPGPNPRGKILVTVTHLLDDLRFGLPRKPEAAHRLDKDTSGCLLLGRHPKAIAHLNVLFKKSLVDKRYWAVVEGGPEADSGTIDLALGRLNPDRGWWMKADPDGQPSVTNWTVLGRGAGESGERLTWLELEPLTGRTHQLRVHCSASGWPILGDPVYGNGPRFDGPGLHLHARSLAIPYDQKKAPVKVEAPAPLHMQERLAKCGWPSVATRPEQQTGPSPAPV